MICEDTASPPTEQEESRLFGLGMLRNRSAPPSVPVGFARVSLVPSGNRTIDNEKGLSDKVFAVCTVRENSSECF